MAFRFFRNQLASVIEWANPQPGVLLAKFPSEHDELKNASKLIIGPGQGALLVYEGRVADALTTEGIYNLETENTPFITTLTKLRTGFESEHKVKVYFFRRAENVNQGWGTAMPIKYVDPVYQLPVELGANGSFSFRLDDGPRFFAEIAGQQDLYTVQQARALLQSRIPSVLATVLASAQFSYQHIDAHLSLLSTQLLGLLTPEFARLGCALTDFRINGTVFDKATQQRIGRISDVSADAQAAAAGGLGYAELEKLKALRDAARNESGLAGAGLQLGAGAELGRVFATEKQEATSPPVGADPVQQLQKLKLLLTEGIITQEEFDAKKKGWLDQL
ncbi:SPFH domain-containing protein [Hymenobacter lutimineralis]|uniref:SPFH domain-containing protein n=1 Tax=Hymenobacter lutimineralis TaxID=2606448 RepID=A0A5D6V1P8_9BACT|nr:SPFH domain-containing protein [Hymenobacter lutimineralis]TYZ09197.1 SPFH domain-containing protein [Hymenobacter lutimineralis]